MTYRYPPAARRLARAVLADLTEDELGLCGQCRDRPAQVGLFGANSAGVWTGKEAGEPFCRPCKNGWHQLSDKDLEYRRESIEADIAKGWVKRDRAGVLYETFRDVPEGPVPCVSKEDVEKYNLAYRILHARVKS